MYEKRKRMKGKEEGCGMFGRVGEGERGCGRRMGEREGEREGVREEWGREGGRMEEGA